MKHFLFVIGCICLFVASSLPYNFRQMRLNSRIRYSGTSLLSNVNDVIEPPPYWYSPDFKESDIKEWFVIANKPLLRVGGRGIQDTHVASLLELLSHHAHVRVKVSSMKQSAHTLAAQFMDNTAISNNVSLLLIKQREILFGRKLSTQ